MSVFQIDAVALTAEVKSRIMQNLLDGLQSQVKISFFFFLFERNASCLPQKLKHTKDNFVGFGILGIEALLFFCSSLPTP